MYSNLRLLIYSPTNKIWFKSTCNFQLKFALIRYLKLLWQKHNKHLYVKTFIYNLLSSIFKVIINSTWFFRMMLESMSHQLILENNFLIMAFLYDRIPCKTTQTYVSLYAMGFVGRSSAEENTRRDH